MADRPANEKLWNMLVLQAKSKFSKWPSLPASKWVHEQYVQRGGRFIAGADNPHRLPKDRSKQARERVTSKDKQTSKDKKKGEK